ncbi:MAG: porin family protein [Patiriisocius sp.]|uniref:porin family protein n=1 Tax=Patiriisocius sp. TaxID=2822396 RepID=UPI003EF2596F
MKKILLVVAVAVFGTSSIIAQELKLGAKAGVNFAKLTGDDLEDADGRTGFHIGFVAEIPLSEKFAVQPELIYSQQGLQQKDEVSIFGFTRTIESKLKLDYINVPIMAKYYFVEGFSVEAGPQIGINVKAEAQTIQTGGDSETDETLDVSDNISTIDLGVGGGLAYQLPMGVFFQARYIIGLSNVNDDDNEGVFGDDFTNSNLSLSVGYKF